MTADVRLEESHHAGGFRLRQPELWRPPAGEPLRRGRKQ